MMHNMHDLQCLNAGITPGCYRDIEPKYDEDDIQVIDPPYSSNVPQDGEKDGRVENEEIHLYFKIIHKISS